MSSISDPTTNKDSADKLSARRIVGIGASSGGLEALQDFFSKIPAETGLAFVVIQHLSPDFKSMMPELLAKHTSLKICCITKAVIPEPDTIYLVGPRQRLVLEQGLLIPNPHEKETVPDVINRFFCSLAKEKGSEAIAVILSGTGSDGSMGVLEIDAAGGRVLVQSPQSASFTGMPNSAIACQVADGIAAPAELARLLENPASRSGSTLSRSTDNGVFTQSDLDPELLTLFNLILTSFNLDLSAYKYPTLLRRIDRRMARVNVESLAHYLEILQSNPAELQSLYADLLIDVSSFFRDSEAFHYLEQELLPVLLTQHNKETELRIWVAACSTGEEVYSLAIALQEVMARLELKCKCKIFATDISAHSLKIASEGVYSEQSVQSLPPGLLSKYFDSLDNNMFRLGKNTRNLVLFSRHNLLTDTPFHKIDLISCRNLLIYLHPDAQKRVIGSLLFALNMKGTLWLGPSESLGELGSDFEVLNSHWKCFRKTGKHHLLHNMKVTRNPVARAEGYSTADPRMNRLYDQLLARHMTPAVLIDENRQLLHVIGQASQYLHPPQGRVTHDLVQLLQGNLKAVVTTLIHSAQNNEQDLILKDIHTDSEPELLLDLSAEHFIDPGSKARYLLIRFISPAASQTREMPPSSENPSVASLSVDKSLYEQIQYMENQLQETRFTLQNLMEEMDSTNEQLQSSNEELMASNEELQSTNEELQSVNEEVFNINSELQERVRELAQSNTDIRNLIANSNTGIIITDEMQQLRLFTPAATEIFNILPQDIGRPISHITSKIGDTTLAQAIGQVNSDMPSHRETLTTPDNRHYLRTVSTYTETDSQIRGYIIVFADITEQERAKRTALEHEQHLRQITDSLKLFIWVDDAQGKNQYSNLCMQHYTGMSEDELRGDGYLQVIHPLDRSRIRNAWQTSLARGNDFDAICRYKRFDDVYRWFRVEATPIRDSNNEIVQWIGSCTDINESKGVNQQLSTLIQSAPPAIIVVNEHGRITQSNRKATLWFGYTESELEGQSVSMLLDDSLRELHASHLQNYLKSPEVRSMYANQTVQGRRKSGETFPIEIGLSPIEIMGKQHVAAFITDITLRIQAESTLKQVNDSLEHAIRNRSQALIESQTRLKLAAQAAYIGIFDFNPISKVVTYDLKMFEIMGITPTQDMTINYELWRSCVVNDDLAAQDKILEDAQQNGRTDYSSIYRIHRYDTGELRYISSNRTAVLNADGTVTRLVGVIRDITDRHMAEQSYRALAQNLEQKVQQRTQQLAQSENRFRRMADVSPVLFWIGDARGRLTWINTTWQNWTGRSLDEQSGDQWFAKIHPDDRKMVQTQLAAHFHTGEDVALEYRLLNAQNTYGWLFHQGSALLSEQHEIEGFIATCTDISWQKERNEEQQRIEKKLEEATKLDSLGLMAGGVAHDFNNLLTGILGNIEIAQWETGAEQEMLKTVLNDARSATLRAADLCKQMLAYSGKGQFITENCYVNSLIRETLRFIQTSIKEEVKIFTELDPSVPPILADKVQLQQIIMNLTINAGESIPEKGTLWIRTGTTSMELEEAGSFANPDAATTGPAIFIEVEDTGTGMTRDEIKKAFEPFYSTKFIGRGLGLSAVQGIIKGHQGQLVINSIKGAGTLMRAVLPLQQSEQIESKPETMIQRSHWINKVLIVDDEEIVARILQRYLDHQSIEAEFVLNGKECINRFIGNPNAYDLVLLDLTMAGMDGYETFRQIRQINSHVKVVLISGFTEKEATRQFDPEELAGFLPKPISEKTLVDMINRLKRHS